MGAKESRMKHKESKKAREVRRAMDGSKTTVQWRTKGIEQAINIKLRGALNKSVQYRSAHHR